MSGTISDTNDQTGFFHPDSKIWQVNREMILLAAGGRALLMQLAHPKVAAGVAEHSRFQENPFARLHRTMSAMWSIVFDLKTQARAALKGIESVHARVRGNVRSGEPSFSGAPYDANEQDLLLWVHATLIDSALVAYDLLVAPMTETEKTAYYDDSKTLAALFGIEETLIPPSLGEFDTYMKSTISSGPIAVGPTARRLARDVLYARPWIFRIAGPPFRFVTAGLLPEKLREGYDLKWNAGKERTLAACAHAIRALLPLVPSPIRIVPNARIAEKAGRS